MDEAEVSSGDSDVQTVKDSDTFDGDSTNEDHLDEDVVFVSSLSENSLSEDSCSGYSVYRPTNPLPAAKPDGYDYYDNYTSDDNSWWDDYLKEHVDDNDDFMSAELKTNLTRISEEESVYSQSDASRGTSVCSEPHLSSGRDFVLPKKPPESCPEPCNDDRAKGSLEKPVRSREIEVSQEVVHILEDNAKTKSHWLDLSSMKLTHVPPMLLTLIHVKHLYLKGNRLKYLPANFFPCLSSLLWLDLRDNLLTSLPKNIGEHQTLTTLLLEGNRFLELPREIGTIPTLEGLNYRNNPLAKPPLHILQLGLKEILYYLREKLPIYNEEDAKKQETAKANVQASSSGTTLTPSFPHGLEYNMKNKRHSAPGEIQRNEKRKQHFSKNVVSKEKIDKLIQQLKNDLALKAWREKAKDQQALFLHRTILYPELAELNVSAPYDVNENFMAFPSREDPLNRKNGDEKVVRKPTPGYLDNLRLKQEQEVESQIMDLLNKLQQQSRDDKLTLAKASEDLKKVEQLQRRLTRLCHA